MNHDEVDGNNYKDKKDEWLPYVKNDVLCTAFSYARYSKTMEEITGFGMKIVCHYLDWVGNILIV